MLCIAHQPVLRARFIYYDANTKHYASLQATVSSTIMHRLLVPYWFAKVNRSIDSSQKMRKVNWFIFNSSWKYQIGCSLSTICWTIDILLVYLPISILYKLLEISATFVFCLSLITSITHCKTKRIYCWVNSLYRGALFRATMSLQIGQVVHNNIWKKFTSDPRYWNIPVLENNGTFLVYQHCLKMWYLRSLELAGVIQKLTILERKNGLVLSNTRVPVSGTWSILFPNISIIV